MKETVLFIVVDSDNRNIVYCAAIAAVKNEVKKYFGSKNVGEDDPAVPSVNIKCEVTQDDVNALKKIIDSEAINFIAMVGLRDSKFVKGDVIDFTQE